MSSVARFVAFCATAALLTSCGREEPEAHCYFVAHAASTHCAVILEECPVELQSGDGCWVAPTEFYECIRECIPGLYEGCDVECVGDKDPSGFEVYRGTYG
jgi:hypothetical protein